MTPRRRAHEYSRNRTAFGKARYVKKPLLWQCGTAPLLRPLFAAIRARNARVPRKGGESRSKGAWAVCRGARLPAVVGGVSAYNLAWRAAL